MAWTVSADANLGLGRLEESRQDLDVANRICLETQDFAIYQYVLNTLARLELAEGNLAEAKQAGRQSVAMTETLAPQVASVCQLSLARVLIAIGDHDEATDVLENLIAIARTAKLQWALAVACHQRSELHVKHGEYSEAETLAKESLTICQQGSCLAAAADCLQTLAEIAAALESHVEATRLIAASQAIRDTTGYVGFPAERAHAAELIQRLESHLGESFPEPWDEGSRLDLDEAAEYVLRGRGERKRPSSGWASLTPVELNVADLVAHGLTNPQIGERLFISKRTVQGHVSRILAKLSLSSRSEIAALVASRAATEAKTRQ